MTLITGILFISLSAVQALGTAIYLVLITRLFSQLRAQHPDVYETLGRPSMILNNTIGNNVRVVRWLWRKDFLSLSDAHTVASARRIRTLLITLYANFAVLMLAFFVLQAGFYAEAG